MSASQLSFLSGVELRRPSNLVERALVRLEDGPLPTAVIANEVLYLRGNPRAASVAVFTLLGSDPRVQVDAQGIWSLAPPASHGTSSRPLRLQNWMVVDVETTGGSIGYGHRVIEVGMARISGGEVSDAYESLVNPGRPVPRNITSLTGISQAMLDPAPPFAAIAGRVGGELEGTVFVGHNVNFDWRFISSEIERCSGHSLTGPRVCTLRLARRLLPHLRSRSLGSLALYFGINMDRHHRALDDARATAFLLLRLIEMLEERGLSDWAGLRSFLRTPPRRRKRRRSIVTSADAA